MKSVLNYSLSFILCIGFIAHGQSKKWVRKALKTNDSALQIALLSKAITADSENLEAYFYRGIAKAHLNDHIGAILDFTKVIFFKPDADTYYNRGNSKFNLNDFKGAIEDYEAALKQSQGIFTEASYNLGLAQFHLKDYKKALITFNTILKNDPNHLPTHIQLGHTLLELEYHKYAFVFFNRCVQLDRNTHTFYNRGLAYLEVNQYQKARADFLKAIALNTNNVSAYFYLGISQLFSKDYATAVSSFETALSFNALDYDALIGVALASYQNNNTVKAKMAFRKAKYILKAQHPPSETASLFENSSWYHNEHGILKVYVEKLEAL